MPSLRKPKTTRLRTGVDATPSQLDIIAEVNARAAREHLVRRLRRMAVAGAAVLLAAALWWSMKGDGARAPAPPLPRAAMPAEPLRDRPAAVAQDTPAASSGALPASAPIEATAVPLAETAAAEDRARKARTRREAEARALALQVQQERSQAQSQERQERQQREAEREAQQARELADAAPRRAPEPAPAPAQPAVEPRRGVRERCAASGNLFSELFCQSRECRRPEHANEALCVRLHEIEESQRSGSR